MSESFQGALLPLRKKKKRSYDIKKANYKRQKNTFSAVWKYCFTRSSTLSVVPSAGLLTNFPKLRSMSRIEKHRHHPHLQLLIITIPLTIAGKKVNAGLFRIVVPFICKAFCSFQSLLIGNIIFVQTTPPLADIKSSYN